MPRKPAEQTVHPGAIIHAAALVFQRKGYHGATMADIAAEVDLTAGSLYHHFTSKQELLVAVLDTGMTQITGAVREVLAREGTPAEHLRAIIHTHIRSIIDNANIATAVIFESRALLDSPDVRAPYVQQRDTLERLYRAVVQAGIAAGDFRAVDVGIVIKALFGALNWVSVWYRADGRLSRAQIADAIADTFLAALGGHAH